MMSSGNDYKPCYSWERYKLRTLCKWSQRRMVHRVPEAVILHKTGAVAKQSRATQT